MGRGGARLLRARIVTAIQRVYAVANSVMCHVEVQQRRSAGACVAFMCGLFARATDAFPVAIRFKRFVEVP